MKMKISPLKWYHDKVKSHFKDGDLLETLDFTFAIAKTKEQEEITPFKEAEVKELLNMVHSGQISFSKFVEMLNDATYDKLAKDGGLVTMMEVVRVVELFIMHNHKTEESELDIKMKEFASYVKAYAVKGAMENLKRYDAIPKIH